MAEMNFWEFSTLWVSNSYRSSYTTSEFITNTEWKLHWNTMKINTIQKKLLKSTNRCFEVPNSLVFSFYLFFTLTLYKLQSIVRTWLNWRNELFKSNFIQTEISKISLLHWFCHHTGHHWIRFIERFGWFSTENSGYFRPHNR